MLSLGHSFLTRASRSPSGPASPFAPLRGAVAQAKKGDSLAAASETKAQQQAIPPAFALNCLRIDPNQAPRLRLGMMLIHRTHITR
jgi:hypothetical protein